ncbi:MAG TPA: sulfatase [Blastocatellia bacterium]|nr:sulfatase [Blastocatellia bacterium]
MKAVALLLVLIVAKLAMLAGRPIQISAWTAIAYLWQDVLVAIVFGMFERLFERFNAGRIACWIIYMALVGFVAINVPVARVLSSSLTWQMLGATRGALLDSIRHHATVCNLLLMMLVIVVGITFPFLHRRSSPTHWRTSRLFLPSSVLFAALIAVGPAATSHIDTVGMDRNAITALATTLLPRINANTEGMTTKDWRKSPITQQDGEEDLSSLCGAATGRNVVLILLESAGARYLQVYGANSNPMPHLTEIARSSISFRNAYSVYPESIKGLFSVLCSRYPAVDTDAEKYSSIKAPSIAAVLKEAGYHTALFHSGRFMYLGMEGVVANRGYDVLEDAGAIGGNQESSFGVDESSTVQRALDWIDGLGSGQRFFLTYLPIAGHHPYDTPEPGPFRERTELDRYLNALHYADESMSALISGVRERGLEERTLFVIFGDHGEAFGQHDGNFGHSLFLYDENIRVPYLISAPGLIKASLEVTRPISLIDTAPTILDLLGVTAPNEYQGLSALQARAVMSLFYTDYSLTLMGVRDGGWKYLYEMESGRSKLFDVVADPEEARDLALTHPDRVAAYRTRVCEWASAQKALIKGVVNKEGGE